MGKRKNSRGSRVAGHGSFDSGSQASPDSRPATHDPRPVTSNDLSRRDFVQSAAAGAAGFTIVPRHVLGGRGYVAPSDKPNVACIGVGGKGRSDIDGVRDAGGNIYAFADVDDESAADAYRSYPTVPRFRDYREMLDKMGKNIDAITVSIPDHSHASAAMLGLRSGKHVFCQKPLARTLYEVRTLEQTAAANPKLSTQMGNQGHAGEGTRELREWVEAGVIGTVREVQYWTNRPIWPQGLDRPLEAYNVPPTLDWDLWLGPAPVRPYHPSYCPFNWRGWWDFGTGALGDMACHGMDAAFWALGFKWPTRVEAECTELHPESGPKSSRITYWFPPKNGHGEIKVTWRDGGLNPVRPTGLDPTKPWPIADIGGQIWIGDEGTMIAGMYGEDPFLVDVKKDAAIRANPPAKKYARSPGHYVEWINGMKGGAKPMSSFDGHAGPLTEMVLLGVLAARTGARLDIDQTTGMATNIQLPALYLKPEFRSGWSV